MFEKKNSISSAAINILKKRYFMAGETTWDDVVNRVMNTVLATCDDVDQFNLTKEMILHRYFVPNSPCLVNSGKKGMGLLACFVVDFPDNIDGIIKTKGDFFHIARKGGGCGTTLSKLRPEGAKVSGSTHGYAGGPLKFADTISHDMEAITQAGFRSMAIMLTMSVYHPDIIQFITAKANEGTISNANISVVVDDEFMRKVLESPNSKHEVYHEKWGHGFLAKDPGSGKIYSIVGEKDSFTEDFCNHVLTVNDVYNAIVEGAWKNGEPGILFYERMNNSPYKYSHQEILATNPCSEQPLPFNGCCNLGSLDLSKFLDDENRLDLKKLEVAVRLSVRFLNYVIHTSDYPTKEIKEWSIDNQPIGLGIMGYADMLLHQEIAYGSQESLDQIEFIMKFVYDIAEDESIIIGEELEVPKNCQVLPVPRRNITLTTIAPTGTISLIAGCSSGIEPIFSEIVVRNDKTGSYTFESNLAEKPFFRCAVSSNGATEVTWQEHLAMLNSAQRFVDSGVSKTINCPNHTHRETVYNIFLEAWKLPFIKGLTIYRNGSRKVEVLSPKNLKKDKCPRCSSPIVDDGDKKRCTNKECSNSLESFMPD